MAVALFFGAWKRGVAALGERARPVMTSDSLELSRQHDMALLQSRATSPPAPFHAPTPDENATTNTGHHHPTVRLPIVPASSMAVLPSKKVYGERSRLLDAANQPSQSSSPTSSTSTSPSPSEQDLVYPWHYRTTSTTKPIATSTLAGPLSGAVKVAHHEVAPHTTDQRSTTVFSKILARAQSLSSSLPTPSSAAAAGFNIVAGGSRGHQQERRRHSILRVSSNKSLTDKPLRKSASVEFALHHEALHKLTLADRRETTSNATPRRLTNEEKEALYKVRPDLEVGPSPFYKEQMRELEQRNQRRILFAIFGGIMCIMFLLVVYYIVSIA